MFLNEVLITVKLVDYIARQELMISHTALCCRRLN